MSSNAYPPKQAADRRLTTKEREQADNFFNQAAGEVLEGASSLDKNLRNLMLSVYEPYIKTRSGVLYDFGNVLGTIDSASTALDEFLDPIEANFEELMKPVSTALGGVATGVSNLLSNPTGAISEIPAALMDSIRQVWPELARTLENTFKDFKADNIKNLPSGLVGSIRSILGTLDALLTFPIILISDIYFGAMALMQQISKEIDELIGRLYKFVFNLLDDLLPLEEIFELLDTIQEVANEVSGIASIFTGANIISQYTNLVSSYAGSIESLLRNPLDLAFAYLPEEVSQGLYLIRNPQEVLNRIIPPEASEFFSRASQVLGVGFNGNMGYGLQSVLTSLQNGVINSVLTNFSAQYKILTPLLQLLPEGGIGKNLPPGYTAWIANPGVATAAQQKVPDKQPEEILPQKGD